MKTIKQVLDEVQLRYSKQDYTEMLGEKLIYWLEEKMEFETVLDRDTRWVGRAMLRMVDYDHVIDKNTRMMYEVVVSTLNGKGYMTIAHTPYDVTNKVKNRIGKEEIKAKIKKLDEGYDYHANYIDNGKQWREATQRNERIRREQEELQKLF